VETQIPSAGYVGSIERKTRSTRRRVSPTVASREVDSSRSVICKPIRGSLGSPRHRVHSLFPNPDVDFSRSAVRSSSVTITSSSFRDASPLQSSFVRSPRSGPFGHDHRAQWSLSFTCLGFRPSWRHHVHAATSRETSQVPLRSVLRLSQPLDGLLRTHACELISSRYRVQGSLCSGASLPAQPPFLVGRSLPPCRCFIVALRACFHFRRNQRAPTCDAPRLRGFYLRKAAFYESGYSPRPHPLPSSVSSPPGLPFSRRQYRLTQHLPLMMFPRLGLHAVCPPFGDQP